MASGSAIGELIRRARITRTDDSGAVQRVQVDVQGDPTHEFDHLQPYGLTGVPPVGARTLLLSVGAIWEHLVALVTGHTDRPRDLASGDVSLYSAHPARVDLRAAGTTVQGPMLTAKGYTDAEGGFRKAGAVGKTGTLVWQVVKPGPPPSTATILTETYTGGIVTGVEPGVPWTVGIGDVVTAIWTPG
ncbi:MAG: phage baseplate assembly protein [Acidobacteria bacterium]|nr:phage baseplate assembly protein [Acidobacteriota bacterium]